MAQQEQLKKNPTQPGILAALGAALLFGGGTPLAKLLLADVSPWLNNLSAPYLSNVRHPLSRWLCEPLTVHP
jgi:drug/metabolite transporter (DMT)-like permease